MPAEEEGGLMKLQRIVNLVIRAHTGALLEHFQPLVYASSSGASVTLTCVRLHSVVRGRRGHFPRSQRPSSSTHASIPCTRPSCCRFNDYDVRILFSRSLNPADPGGQPEAPTATWVLSSVPTLYYLRRFRTFRCARVIQVHSTLL